MKKLNKIIIGIFMLIATSSFTTNCFAMKNNKNSNFNNGKKVYAKKEEKNKKFLGEKRKYSFQSQENNNSNLEENDDEDSFIYKTPENTRKYENLEKNIQPSYKKTTQEGTQPQGIYMRRLSFTENEGENLQPANFGAIAINQMVNNNNNFHNIFNDILNDVNTNNNNNNNNNNILNNNNNNNVNNINDIINDYISTKDITNK